MDKDIESNDPVKIEDTQNRISEIMNDDVSIAVEALLFASPVPLTESQIARIIGKSKQQVQYIIDTLNSNYMGWGRSFRIEKFGEGFRLYTLPEFDKFISRLADLPRPAKLSRAALEVLSIVAYRQPVIKSEIERVRGIESDGVIRTLIERGLIAICGRSDGPGRPLLYKTTQEFLEFFGIADLLQLPQPEIPTPAPEPTGGLTIIRPPEDSETQSD